VIDGDAGDALIAQGGWATSDTVTIDGNGYSAFENASNRALIFVDSDIAVNAF
jgi:hypothetical protein